MSGINYNSGRSFGYTAAAVLVGLFVFGYGLVLVPESTLGGGWIAAIGLSVVLGASSTPSGQAGDSASRTATGARCRWRSSPSPRC